MISEIEFENLFQKMLLNGVEGVSACKEYCLKRSQAELTQVKIDNSFLDYLSKQSTLAQCSFDVLWLAAKIYCQNDGYAKPANFIKLLEEAASLPLPAVHRAYLVLEAKVRQENTLKNIKDLSQKLATQDNAIAQYNLGIMYATGLGISAEELPQKDSIAVQWFRKAAAQGHADAQCSLGIMYATGRGIPAEELLQKDSIAVQWFRKAAAQGHADAQQNLGSMYEEGRGIPAEEIPQKDSIAAQWYRKAAAQGDALAQCSLGCMYEAGRGIPAEEMPQKDSIAVQWFRKAAAQGDTLGEFKLGFMYSEGRGIPTEEMPQKDIIAVQWFRKAAAEGNDEAQFYLGLMYEQGRGILENEESDKAVLAYFWCRKSVLSLPYTKGHLDDMTITPYQLKKATMMLIRGLDYPQVTYLFQKDVFQSFLLLALVIKNKNSPSLNPGLLERLPSDLLFTIAQQLGPASAEEIRDIYHKLIPTLSKELDFKAKSNYLVAGNPSLFFKSNSVAASVKSGAPLPLQEVEKYAKENPESMEAQVYNQLKN